MKPRFTCSTVMAEHLIWVRACCDSQGIKTSGS